MATASKSTPAEEPKAEGGGKTDREELLEQYKEVQEAAEKRASLGADADNLG